MVEIDSIYTKEMYECSYKEVITILMGFAMEDLKKIPVEEIDFLYDNMDKSYECDIDYSKSLKEQRILPITEVILASLYKNYLTTEEERREILQKEQKKLDNKEKELETKEKEVSEELEKMDLIYQKYANNLPAKINSKPSFIERIIMFFKRIFIK